MRPAQKSNRARGRGSRKGTGNVVNRVFDSSGPEGKVRGTPQQIIDKYLTLARDAQTSGDRVVAENFLQHAEHYQRLLLQATAAQSERRESAAGDGDEESGQDTGRDGGAETRRQPAAADAREGDAGGSEGEVGGLTTIDSSEDADGSLIVPVEENGSAEARRTARGGRRNGSGKSSGRKGAARGDGGSDGGGDASEGNGHAGDGDSEQASETA